MTKPGLLVDEIISSSKLQPGTDLIPVFGPDNQDVLYVRVRREYNEGTEQAFDRAERIARALSK